MAKNLKGWNTMTPSAKLKASYQRSIKIIYSVRMLLCSSLNMQDVLLIYCFYFTVRQQSEHRHNNSRRTERWINTGLFIGIRKLTTFFKGTTALFEQYNDNLLFLYRLGCSILVSSVRLWSELECFPPNCQSYIYNHILEITFYSWVQIVVSYPAVLVQFPSI